MAFAPRRHGTDWPPCRPTSGGDRGAPRVRGEGFCDQWGLQAPVYRGRDVSLSSTRPCTSPTRAAWPDAIEADIGGGAGWQPVEFGVPFALHVDGDSAEVAIAATTTRRCSRALRGRCLRPAAPRRRTPGSQRAGDRDSAGHDRARVGVPGAGAHRARQPRDHGRGFPGGHPCDYLYSCSTRVGPSRRCKRPATTS